MQCDTHIPRSVIRTPQHVTFASLSVNYLARCVIRTSQYVLHTPWYVTSTLQQVIHAPRYVTHALLYVTHALRYVNYTSRYVIRTSRYVIRILRWVTGIQQGDELEGRENGRLRAGVCFRDVWLQREAGVEVRRLRGGLTAPPVRPSSPGVAVAGINLLFRPGLLQGQLELSWPSGAPFFLCCNRTRRRRGCRDCGQRPSP